MVWVTENFCPSKISQKMPKKKPKIFGVQRRKEIFDLFLGIVSTPRVSVQTHLAGGGGGSEPPFWSKSRGGGEWGHPPPDLYTLLIWNLRRFLIYTLSVLKFSCNCSCKHII